MSRRKNDHDDQGSGPKLALLAGLVGVGIGALGAFIASKFSDKEKETVPPIAQLTLPRKPKKRIFQNTGSSSKTEKSAKDLQLQEMLTCPISLEIMDDPVTIPECGHTFDRITITPVLDKFFVCPLCKKPTSSERLVPNYQLKSVIDHFKETRR